MKEDAVIVPNASHSQTPAPPALFLKSTDEDPQSDVRIKAEKKFGLRNKHVILCSNCGNSITLPEYTVSVNGEHIHTFTNPEGFSYEIGCFSDAQGCIVDSDPVMEHTWFKGFTWRLSLCSSCLVHMGWCYERGSERFFGLIIDRLSDASATY
jgi:hypothetical protein